MCECYKIGGRFIAEDPDCPIHGREATERDEQAAQIIDSLKDRIYDLECNVRELMERLERLEP